MNSLVFLEGQLEKDDHLFDVDFSPDTWKSIKQQVIDFKRSLGAIIPVAVSEELSHSAPLASFVDMKDRLGITEVDTNNPCQVTPHFVIYLESVLDSEIYTACVSTFAASGSLKLFLCSSMGIKNGH